MRAPADSIEKFLASFHSSFFSAFSLGPLTLSAFNSDRHFCWFRIVNFSIACQFGVLRLQSSVSVGGFRGESSIVRHEFLRGYRSSMLYAARSLSFPHQIRDFDPALSPQCERDNYRRFHASLPRLKQRVRSPLVRAKSSFSHDALFEPHFVEYRFSYRLLSRLTLFFIFSSEILGIFIKICVFPVFFERKITRQSNHFQCVIWCYD